MKTIYCSFVMLLCLAITGGPVTRETDRIIGESLDKVEIRATEAFDTEENWKRWKKLAISHHSTEMVINQQPEDEIAVGEFTIV